MVQLDEDFTVVLPLSLGHGAKFLRLFRGPPFLGLSFRCRSIAGAEGCQRPWEVAVGFCAEDAAEHSGLVSGLRGAMQLRGDLHFTGF